MARQSLVECRVALVHEPVEFAVREPQRDVQPNVERRRDPAQGTGGHVLEVSALDQ